MTFTQKLKQIAIAFDQLINTLIGLFTKRGGWADESISAKAYRLRDDSKGWGRAYKVINKIFFWQQNHCEGSYLNEINRTQISPKYR